MNFGEMISWVRLRLVWEAEDAEATQRIKSALQTAYDYVNGYRDWKRLRRDETATLNEDEYSVDVPTSLTRLYAVWIVDASGSARLLDYRDYSWFLNLFGDPSQLSAGTPAYYMVLGATDGSLGATKLKLIIAPPANENLTVHMLGYAYPSPLTNNADVPWFPTQYHSILPRLAFADLAATEEGFDRQVAQENRQMAMALLDEMVFAEPTGITAVTSIPMAEPHGIKRT